MCWSVKVNVVGYLCPVINYLHHRLARVLFWLPVVCLWNEKPKKLWLDFHKFWRERAEKKWNFWRLSLWLMLWLVHLLLAGNNTEPMSVWCGVGMCSSLPSNPISLYPPTDCLSLQYRAVQIVECNLSSMPSEICISHNKSSTILSMFFIFCQKSPHIVCLLCCLIGMWWSGWWYTAAVDINWRSDTSRDRCSLCSIVHYDSRWYAEGSISWGHDWVGCEAR